MNELILNASQFGIQKNKAEQIEAIFVPMVSMLKNFEASYDIVIQESRQGITPGIANNAKKLRLDIGKIRIQTDKIRKSEKEEYLRAGKAIDGVANILKFAVVEKEEKLKEIETYYERIEKERLEKIKENREQELMKYDYEPNGGNIDLATMEDDVYKKFLDGYKLSYENKIKAEKEAEIERLKKIEEEKKRQEEIEKENKRLKKEAEEREKIFEKERKEREIKEKIEFEKNEKLRIEREKKERELSRKLDEEKRIQEEKLKKEREERQRIEKELEVKKIEEKRIQEEKLKKEKALLLAPDKDKLLQFASDLQTIKIPMVKNVEAQKILQTATDRLQKTYSDLIRESEKI